MGLFQKLVETYDYMESLAGKETEEYKTPLAPIGFIVSNVNLEITITEDGEFVKSELLFDTIKDKKTNKDIKVAKKIIIPVTQKSACRSNNVEPHPLCDKLSYIYPEDKERHTAYVLQLEDWCNSEFTCSKVQAVLKYVKGGTIRNDIPPMKEETMVCWRVMSADCEEPEEVWKAPSVRDSYTKYYQNKLDTSGEKELDYITGEFVVCRKKHQKISVTDSPKSLISSNDTRNFTYRGNFIDGTEALTIGDISSQKALNTLQWLLTNVGVAQGNRKFICWNPKGIEVPDMMLSLLPNTADTEKLPTPSNYRDILWKSMLGYQNKFTPDDEVLMASFEASGKGRIAICYYSEMGAYDFFERLRYWDETSAWIHPKFGVTSPNLWSIIKASYGTPGAEGMIKVDKDNKILKNVRQRLLQCKMKRLLFPEDIMRSAVQNCSSLHLYSKKQREDLLFTACSIIKKFRYDKFKEEWIMSLEPEKRNRSYQFGRLLAILEKIEMDTYEESTKRESNAIRMQELFLRCPMRTASIVLEKLKAAYYSKLSFPMQIYYEKLIGGIMAIISEFPENEINKPLKEEYLIGYYLQKNEFYTKRNNDNNESEDEE